MKCKKQECNNPTYGNRYCSLHESGEETTNSSSDLITSIIEDSLIDSSFTSDTPTSVDTTSTDFGGFDGGDSGGGGASGSW